MEFSRSRSGLFLVINLLPHVPCAFSAFFVTSSAVGSSVIKQWIKPNPGLLCLTRLGVA